MEGIVNRLGHRRSRVRTRFNSATPLRRLAHWRRMAGYPFSIVFRGLDQATLDSLPVFTYASKPNCDLEDAATDADADAALACVICLSEFEENETGRLLPKCNHSFHVKCIDKWFERNSTCPMCRSLVEVVEMPTSVERGE